MKRIFAFAVAAAVMLSGLPNAFASTESKEILDILTAVKPRIGSTDEYTDFNSSSYESLGEKMYRLNWSKSDDDNQKELSITVSKGGIITEYNIYNSKMRDDSSDRASINRPTDAQVYSNACEQFKKLNPTLGDTFRVEENNGTESLYGNYGYHLQRFENGYRVTDDGGYINMSDDGKYVTDMHINYSTNVKFESAKNIIDKSAAVKSYEEKLGMKLVYSKTYGKDEKIVLQYMPKAKYNQYISAVSGEVFELQNNSDIVYGENKQVMADSGGSAESAKFSEAEIKQIDEVKDLISASEAENIVRKNSVINVDGSYKLQYNEISSYDDGENKKYFYRLNFSSDSKKSKYAENRWISATIDAKTGEIISFYKDTDYGAKDKLTRESAQKKAEEALKILAPAHFGDGVESEFKLSDDITTGGVFRYARFANNIEYIQNGVNIYVNMSDGSVQSYNISYDKEEFPSPEGILSEHDICEKIFAKAEYVPVYVVSRDKDNNKTANLVYDITDGTDMTVDAFTGEPVYERDDAKIGDYTDISGHYAENQIKTLAKYGIGFEEDEFRPDDEITQEDFAALVNSALVRHYPIVICKGFDYSDAYSSLRRSNIVRDAEYAPDSSVTREYACVVMIRALGYEEVAELDNIYMPLYSDITSKPGYTSILSAMGIVGGNGDGTFNPGGKLTRGAAAVMIYNCLSR